MNGINYKEQIEQERPLGYLVSLNENNAVINFRLLNRVEGKIVGAMIIETTVKRPRDISVLFGDFVEVYNFIEEIKEDKLEVIQFHIYKEDIDSKEDTKEEILLGEISRYLTQDLEYKAKGTWEDILRFADKMQEDKRNTETLILSWRIKLEEKMLKEVTRKVLIEPKDIDSNYLDEMKNKHLSEFDNHFNIETQRHGEIKR